MIEVNDHLVEVRNLSVDFHTRDGTVPAVQDVSWYVNRGETLAILGESGSGKSVSSSALMGLIDMPPGRITSGEVLYRGENLLNATPERQREINGSKIAMVFQDTLAAFNPVYQIGWQVAETLRSHGVPKKVADVKALELLERVGIPNASGRFFDYPHQFSGGQRQRIMIAMAIALNPDLLIADEPTTALDVTVQAKILRLLKELQRERGMGLLLITHDLGIVAGIADRVAIMQGGKIVETGTVRQVFETPQHPYTHRLFDAVPGRRVVSETARTLVEQPLLIVQDLSKEYLSPARLFSRGATAAPVLALNKVSFKLERGETLGIVGESGSGKSTLARTLIGLETATGGGASYRGHDLLNRTPAGLNQVRRQIQMVFQDPTASLNPRMSVREIISEPWAIHDDVVPRNKWDTRVRDLLEQVGLQRDHADRYPHQFSGGQRQRIAIARALALQPEIIIFDEAVSSLDVSVQAQVIELLKSLKDDYNLSYLFIAHDLPVVRSFADRVLVMHRGAIVEQGTSREIFNNPKHDYTRELLQSDPALNVHAAI
ncbi:peptide/nickel transport system ATP-binding protein [Phyllobacterium trifolii]|uniref:Peptide/nickel transport system ATP-binding protein n=1 Tax=Phyllobacterium trifolii TaxID=300193 RepID=A0A839ULB5_9HYPH|nr:ABC transporter ATP-binding protein [Phyllobacterium trifolii]MBB3149502.1 peptide/nickel transport system ATP-binding protein [Phyllobacterium trifolii]